MTYNNSACVENALTALKKSFPNSLRSRKAMGIYSALVEATYFALDGHRRFQLDDNFAFSHRWRGNDIISNVASSIASTKENAVVILGQLLGLRPENVFHIFPVSKESSVATVYDYHGRMMDSLPKVLTVNGMSYNRGHYWPHWVEKNEASQALCEFKSCNGDLFHLVAVAECKDNWKSLSIGKHPATHHLLGKYEFRQSLFVNSDTTAILPMDTHFALHLHSAIGSKYADNFTVMGCVGGTDEFKNADLSILNYQRVILIPEFNKASLLAMEGLVKHLENHCACAVRVYPHPMLVARNDTPEAPDGWQQVEMAKAWFLDESENPSVFIKKTVMEQSMTLDEYKDFLCSLNLLSSEKHATQDEDFFWGKKKFLRSIGNKKPIQPNIETVFTRGQTTLIWGPSNSGKSYVALALTMSVATGTRFFNVSGYGYGRKVILVDGETTETMFEEKKRQLMASMSEDERDRFEENCESYLLHKENQNLDETLQKSLIEYVKQQHIELVLFDNLNSLVDKAWLTNTSKLFAFRDKLESAGAGVVFIHHATKAGNSPKGASELVGKSQNVIQIEGKTVLLEELNSPTNQIPDSAKEALSRGDVAFRMTWEESKVFHLAEHTSGICSLGQNSGWVQHGQKDEEADQISTSSEFTSDAGPALLTPTPKSKAEQNDAKVLACFNGEKTLAKKDITAMCSCLSEDMIERSLKNLCDENKLVKLSAGPATKYRLN